MQPYFFPYFEQFRLIASCDLWVVFDTPQFTRRTWVTRNRILNRDKGVTYVSVPVQHTGLDTAIKDAILDNKQDWRGQVLNKLKSYQHEAPHYATVRDFVGDVITEPHETVATLNTAILKAVCHYLGIKTTIQVASLMDMALPEQCEPGEWALHISRQLNATEYRNAAGGRSLFDTELYARHGIMLNFHEPQPRTYATGSFEFVENLSILDWMMWNDVKTLQAWVT